MVLGVSLVVAITMVDEFGAGSVPTCMVVGLTGGAVELVFSAALTCAVVVPTRTTQFVLTHASLSLVFPASALEALDGLMLYFLGSYPDSADVYSVPDD